MQTQKSSGRQRQGRKEEKERCMHHVRAHHISRPSLMHGLIENKQRTGARSSSIVQHVHGVLDIYMYVGDDYMSTPFQGVI